MILPAVMKAETKAEPITRQTACTLKLGGSELEKSVKI